MKFTPVKYPDGFVYVKIDDPKDQTIKMRLNTYEDLFVLNSIANWYKENNSYCKLEIVCMPHGQHDQKFNPNEVNELKLICDFINNMKFEEVAVHAPHSDVTMALLNNSRRIDNSDFINKVLSILNSWETLTPNSSPMNNLILMSTDANGFKPLIKTANSIQWMGDTYSATKYRDPNQHALVQRIDREDFNGSDVLIIDDICCYGGTFVGLAKMLKERNVGRIFGAWYHSTVTNPNPELFELFDHVFFTNSKYDKHEYQIPYDKYTVFKVI